MSIFEMILKIILVLLELSSAQLANKTLILNRVNLLNFFVSQFCKRFDDNRKNYVHYANSNKDVKTEVKKCSY